jgi:hypothetical protein
LSFTFKQMLLPLLRRTEERLLRTPSVPGLTLTTPHLGPAFTTANLGLAFTTHLGLAFTTHLGLAFTTADLGLGS